MELDVYRVSDLNNKGGDKKFRFRGFRERIADINVDVFRRPVGQDPSTRYTPQQLAGDDLTESWFSRGLELWKGKNRTGKFKRFCDLVEPLSQTLPELLFHRHTILRHLLATLDQHTTFKRRRTRHHTEAASEEEQEEEEEEEEEEKNEDDEDDALRKLLEDVHRDEDDNDEERMHEQSQRWQTGKRKGKSWIKRREAMQREKKEKLKNALGVDDAKALLDLLARLVRDLRNYTSEYLGRLLACLTRLVDPKNPILLELVFSCVGFLFKYLDRQLLPIVEDVFRRYARRLMCNSKSFIRDFAMESMAFLLRRIDPSTRQFRDLLLYTILPESPAVADEHTAAWRARRCATTVVLDANIDQNNDDNDDDDDDDDDDGDLPTARWFDNRDYLNGAAQLFFACIKGIQGHFNSKLPSFAAFFLQHLQSPPHRANVLHQIYDMAATLVKGSHPSAVDIWSTFEEHFMSSSASSSAVIVARRDVEAIAVMRMWVNCAKGDRIKQCFDAVYKLCAHVVQHRASEDALPLLLCVLKSAYLQGKPATDLLLACLPAVFKSPLSVLLGPCFLGKLMSNQQPLIGATEARLIRPHVVKTLQSVLARASHLLATVDAADNELVLVMRFIAEHRPFAAERWDFGDFAAWRVAELLIDDELLRADRALLQQHSVLSVCLRYLRNIAAPAKPVTKLLQRLLRHVEARASDAALLSNLHRTMHVYLGSAHLDAIFQLVARHPRNFDSVCLAHDALQACSADECSALTASAAPLLTVLPPLTELPQQPLRHKLLALLALLLQRVFTAGLDQRHLDVINLLAELENTPTTNLHGDRTKALLATISPHLSHDCLASPTADSVPADFFARLCLHELLGALHIRFQPLFAFIYDSLSLVVHAVPDSLAWQIIGGAVMRVEADASLAASRQRQPTPKPSPRDRQRPFSASRKRDRRNDDNNNDDDDSVDAKKRSHPEAGSEHRSAQVSEAPRMHEMLWEALCHFKVLVRRHVHELVDCFVRFCNDEFEEITAAVEEEEEEDVNEAVGNEEDEPAEEEDEVVKKTSSPKEVAKRALTYLQAFDRLGEEGGLTPAVLRPLAKRLETKFLMSDDRELQRYGLRLLGQLHAIELGPYVGRIESIINNRTMMQELMRFDPSFEVDPELMARANAAQSHSSRSGDDSDQRMATVFIAPEHRSVVVPLLVRVVYSKAFGGSRKRKNQANMGHAQLLSYLSKLTPAELGHLVELLTADFYTVDRAGQRSARPLNDVPFRVQEGFLVACASVVKHLGTKIQSYMHVLVALLFELLGNALVSPKKLVKTTVPALVFPQLRSLVVRFSSTWRLGDEHSVRFARLFQQLGPFVETLVDRSSKRLAQFLLLCQALIACPAVDALDLFTRCCPTFVPSLIEAIRNTAVHPLNSPMSKQLVQFVHSMLNTDIGLTPVAYDDDDDDDDDEEGDDEEEEDGDEEEGDDDFDLKTIVVNKPADQLFVFPHVERLLQNVQFALLGIEDLTAVQDVQFEARKLPGYILGVLGTLARCTQNSSCALRLLELLLPSVTDKGASAKITYFCCNLVPLVESDELRLRWLTSLSPLLAVQPNARTVRNRSALVALVSALLQDTAYNYVEHGVYLSDIVQALNARSELNDEQNFIDRADDVPARLAALSMFFDDGRRTVRSRQRALDDDDNNNNQEERQASDSEANSGDDASVVDDEEATSENDDDDDDDDDKEDSADDKEESSAVDDDDHSGDEVTVEDTASSGEETKKIGRSLSAEQWRPLLYTLSCLFTSMNLPTRHASFSVLLGFVAQPLRASVADESETLNVSDEERAELISRVLVPLTRRALRNRALVVRRNGALLLAHIGLRWPALCPDVRHFLKQPPPSAGDKSVKLKVSGSLLDRLVSMSSETRADAMKKLAKRLQRAGLALDSRFLSDTMVSLLWPYVASTPASAAEARQWGLAVRVRSRQAEMEAAVGALQAIGARLEWPGYLSVLRRLIVQLLRIKPPATAAAARRRNASEAAEAGRPQIDLLTVAEQRSEEKLIAETESGLVRGTVAFLESFHFELTDELQTYIGTAIVPPLQQYIHPRGANKDELRLGVVSVLVRMLKLLPVATLEAKLPNLVKRVCETLKSRLEPSRDAARQALVGVLNNLGPHYFRYVLCELAGGFTRGYLLQVLGYTIYELLSQLVRAGLVRSGELDYCLPQTVELVCQDLFGEAAEKKEIREIAAQCIEAQTNRAYASLELLASVSSQPDMYAALMAPLVRQLGTPFSPKRQASMRKALDCIGRGLLANPTLSGQDALVVVFKELEHYRAQAQAAKQAVSKPGNHSRLLEPQPSRYDVLRILPEPRHVAERTAKYYAVADNSDLLPEMMLNLLNSVLKRGRLPVKAPESRSLLEPLGPLFLHCLLDTHHDRVVVAALPSLKYLLDMQLDSVVAHAAALYERVILLLTKARAGSSMQRVCFSVTARLIGDYNVVTLGKSHLKLLLSLATAEIDRPNHHSATFGLLNAIIKRRLLSPRIYDLSKRATELLIQSENDNIRAQCRSLVVAFLIHYPLSPKRLREELDVHLRNLAYEHCGGRESALELLHRLVSDFPTKLLADYAELFFVTVVLRLANEPEDVCRAMAARIVRSLVELTPAHKRSSFVDLTMRWLNDTNKPPIRNVAVQLVGIFADALPSVADDYAGLFASFDAFLPPVFALLVGQSDHATPGSNDNDDEADDEAEQERATAAAEQDTGDSPASDSWKLVYLALQTVEKCLAQPQLAQRLHELVNWQQLWSLVVVNLNHAHIWIRAVSLRLLDWYFINVLLPRRPTDDCSDDALLTSFADARRLSSALLRVLFPAAFSEQISALLQTVLLHFGHYIAVRSELRTPPSSSSSSSSSFSSDLLVSFVQRCSGVIRRERNGSKDTVARKKIALLSWMASLVAAVDRQTLSSFVQPLVMPVYLILDSKERSHHENLVKAAAEKLLAAVQRYAPAGLFAETYEAVRAEVAQRRHLRRQAIKLLSVTNPEAAEHRRKKQYERKKKRRLAKFEPLRQARATIKSKTENIFHTFRRDDADS